jgi:hypothetical protein
MKTIIPFRYRCVSLDMLEAGWAVVYEQSNAAYGKYGKERFLAVEAAAKYVIFLYSLPTRLSSLVLAGVGRINNFN